MSAWWVCSFNEKKESIFKCNLNEKRVQWVP